MRTFKLYADVCGLGLQERVTYSLVLDILMQDVDVAIKPEDKLPLSVREK